MIGHTRLCISALPTHSVPAPVPPPANSGVACGVFVAVRAMGFSQVVPLRPALTGRISNVFPRCSKKEVGGVYTGRVVAPVADVEPVGDGAIRKLPRNAMCDLWPVPHRDHAVSEGVSVCGPLPTLVRRADRNFLPKAICERGLSVLIPVRGHSRNLRGLA